MNYDHFETLWSKYIRTLKRGGRSQGVKETARKSYDRALREVSHEDLDIRLDNYIALCERENKIGTEFVSMAQTWFCSGWKQHIEEPEKEEPYEYDATKY